MTRLTQSVALACGTAGAFVDVSSYANLLEGSSRSWGRQSEFEDTAPGTFSFTLDNSDGRFNPGSTILATPVTEGMQVCWQLGSRLVAGTILAIEPSFPGSESAWAQVTITCDDMLGNAARNTIDNLGANMVAGHTPYFFYRLNEPSGVISAADTYGQPALRGGTSLGSGASRSDGISSGVEGPDSDTVFQFVATAPTEQLLGSYFDGRTYNYPALSRGAFGVWVTPGDDSNWEAVISFGTATAKIYGQTGAGTYGLISGSLALTPAGPILPGGVPAYVAAEVTWTYSAPNYTYTINVYINGVLATTNTGAPTTTALSAAPTSAYLYVSALTTTTTTKLSHFSHTATLVHEERALATTEALRIAALVEGVPEVTLDTVPTLSTAILGVQDTQGQSVLDALNDVVRAEQGSIYSATTGTLTAPVEKVKVRARDRVAAVDYTFNVETEASGGTDFIRDITNMIQTVTVDGTDTSVTYTDTTLADRVGSKSASESVPFRDLSDLYIWGTDRVFRGANVALRAVSLTVDALTTPTDRTADLLALVPGDRIQITGLPTSLGFTTWDGWLLGVEEQHSLTEHTFTLYLQPVLPDPIILDTDYLTAGGNLSLTSNITNSATSISVTSSDGSLFTTGADLPEKIRVESECMNVTAVSGASSPQTFTVTRGVTDPVTGLATTAVSHLAAVTLELADYNVLAF